MCNLRILAVHAAENSKFCNFWTFWLVIQLINHHFISVTPVTRNRREDLQYKDDDPL